MSFYLSMDGNIRVFRENKASVKQLMASKEAIGDSRLLLTALLIRF